MRDSDKTAAEAIIPNFGELLEKRAIHLSPKSKAQLEVSRIFKLGSSMDGLTLKESREIHAIPSNYHSVLWTYECLFPSPTLSIEVIVTGTQHFLSQLEPFQPLAKSALKHLRTSLRSKKATLPLMLEYKESGQRCFFFLDRRTFAFGAEGVVFRMGIVS
ncbi:MAG: hypothetical protein AAF587_33840 [Bacteroidota bacterium]